MAGLDKGKDGAKMARPSDYIEALCQQLTDDLVELRSMNLDGPASRIVQRMLDRIEGFDHSFGRPADPAAARDDDDAAGAT